MFVYVSTCKALSKTGFSIKRRGVLWGGIVGVGGVGMVGKQE